MRRENSGGENLGVTIRVGKVEEILDLRHEILRGGLPRELANFEGDDEPATRHVVAELEGTIIGCATIVRRAWQDKPAWQLRGMAVAKSMQGHGIGAMLLDEIQNIARAEKYSLQLWCNARTSATKFY